MKTKLLTLVFALAVGAAAYGQENCQAVFDKVLDDASFYRKMVDKTGFEMSYRVRVVMKSGQVYTDQTRLKYTGDKYFLSSATTEVYRDKKDMVTIDKANRMIMVISAAASQMQVGNSYMPFMDSIRRQTIVKSCEREFGSVKPGVGYLKIILVPKSNTFVSRQGIERAVYWVDLAKNEVSKVKVVCKADGDWTIRDYEVVIDEVKYEVKGEAFQGSAIARVTNGGRVLSTFSAYKFIDKR